MTTKLWIGRHLKSPTSAQQRHTAIQIQSSNKPSHLHFMATSLQMSSVPPTDYEIHQINLHSAKLRQNRNRASSQARTSELREIQRVLNRVQRPLHLSSLQPNFQILSSSRTPTMQIPALRTSSPNRSLSPKNQPRFERLENSVDLLRSRGYSSRTLRSIGPERGFSFYSRLPSWSGLA